MYGILDSLSLNHDRAGVITRREHLPLGNVVFGLFIETRVNILSPFYPIFQNFLAIYESLNQKNLTLSQSTQDFVYFRAFC